MTDPLQVHRATASLRRAIAAGPDDFAHPDHEELMAFAEGSLGDVDRELVETHIGTCAQCAEDVHDIAEVREQLSARPSRPNTWKPVVAGVAAIAAVLLLVIILRKPDQGATTKEASVSSAPSASPREAVLSREDQAVVDVAVAAGRVDVPANARALGGAVGQLLGATAASSAMLPMSPSGTVVASASPQLAWRTMAGALSYRVAVFDEAFHEVASSGPLTAGSVTSISWTPAEPLPANVPLAWQVTARMKDGSDVLAPAPPRPEARFTVLDAAAARKIADLRARLADQPIALGILLAKAGLVDDAAREFDRAAKAPADAGLAAKLRASLRESK